LVGNISAMNEAWGPYMAAWKTRAITVATAIRMKRPVSSRVKNTKTQIAAPTAPKR